MPRKKKRVLDFDNETEILKKLFPRDRDIRPKKKRSIEPRITLWSPVDWVPEKSRKRYVGKKRIGIFYVKRHPPFRKARKRETRTLP